MCLILNKAVTDKVKKYVTAQIPAYKICIIDKDNKICALYFPAFVYEVGENTAAYSSSREYHDGDVIECGLHTALSKEALLMLLKLERNYFACYYTQKFTVLRVYGAPEDLIGIGIWSPIDHPDEYHSGMLGLLPLPNQATFNKLTVNQNDYDEALANFKTYDELVKSLS